MRDELIFGSVMAIRFSVPLLILRYPLPGILVAIAADADRAILHAYTSLPLDNYQFYDKSLDVFYLSIAYVATLRNWRDPTAVTIGRFLWFYRLFGVALFALVGDHRLLFLFPAVFEFYFIIYETVRVRWIAERLTGSDLLLMAALAWMLKLPQEYWLHVARRGTTAWTERNIYRVHPSTGLLLLIPAVLALVGALVVLGRFLLRWLPPADHSRRFDANKYDSAAQQLPGRSRTLEPILNPALLEKIGLVTLVGVVFTEFVPGIDASTVQITFGLTFLVVANAALTFWFGGQGTRWRSPVGDFAVTCAINAPIMFALSAAAGSVNASVAVSTASFFVLLASLLIGLHDRYRHGHQWRQLPVEDALGQDR
jgi:hypothetical protein